MHTDPFALERIRLNEEQLRRQVAAAPRRPVRPRASSAAVPAQRSRLRLAFAGAFGRDRTPEPCTDC